MSSIPPSGSNRRESQGAEAARRGVSRYQIRMERFLQGEAADPRSRRIRWNRLDQQQQDAIKQFFPRRKWKELVDHVIAEQDYYDEHGTGTEEYQDYWRGQMEDQYPEDYDDVPDAVMWYHRRRS